MSDDYLWDGAGVPDADTERAARLLGRLRTPLPPIPDLDRAGSPEGLRYGRAAGSPEGLPYGDGDDDTRRLARTSVAQPFRAARSYTGVRFFVPALAAAAAILLMIGTTWRSADAARSWEVARMAGQPRVDA